LAIDWWLSGVFPLHLLLTSSCWFAWSWGWHSAADKSSAAVVARVWTDAVLLVLVLLLLLLLLLCLGF